MAQPERPSSCGQHQIADIGFRGGLTKVNGVQVEAFDMFIGGKLGANARFNELIKGKIPASEIHKTVGKLLHFFEANKQPGELFADFSKRLPKEEIKKALEPEVAAPAAV